VVQIHSPRPILIGPTAYRIRGHKREGSTSAWRKTQELITLNAFTAPSVFPFHPKCSAIIVYASQGIFLRLFRLYQVNGATNEQDHFMASEPPDRRA
jgi:hypothetical protein